MKILFMGTPVFAQVILEYLLQSRHEVVGVVTQPDRPVGRKRTLTAPPVKELAVSHGLAVYQPEHIREASEVNSLIALDYELIVTAAYGQFLPQSLLNSPEKGAINVHASLLPKYRGGAPVHYAIWKGDPKTGVSIIEMVKKMDAGDILNQASIPIMKTDDVGILFDKLAHLGGKLLLETLDAIEQDAVHPVAQKEAEVTYSPIIDKTQEQLNWNQTASQIDQQVRAFRPHPSSYTLWKGQRVKIWEGHVCEDINSNEVPGQIIEVTANAILIQCGDNTVYAITEWQESGKKRTTIQDWLNGNQGISLVGQSFEMTTH